MIGVFGDKEKAAEAQLLLIKRIINSQRGFVAKTRYRCFIYRTRCYFLLIVQQTTTFFLCVLFDIVDNHASNIFARSRFNAFKAW